MPTTDRAETTGSFLCPTELDRLRVVEASGRVRVARTIGAAVIGLALVLAAPWVGWWTLIGFAIVAVDFATLEPRLRRSPRPERIAAASLILALVVIGATVALSGGPESPLLPWLVIPAMTSATRFRREVVVALGGLSVVVALAVTLPVDPDALVDDPSPLIVTLALLAVVSVIAGALLHGELEQRDLAVLDPLTGLLNRASLESRGVEIEQQALLSGAAVSLVVCDIDSFKQINDVHGHERGDAVLRDVALELRRSLRSFELVYRIGGEEFLVLLPGVGLKDAVEVAERVRAAVAAARPGGLEVTVSAGVAAASGEAVRYDNLFGAADEALLSAKRDGRNQVQAADRAQAAASPGERRFAPDAGAAPLG
jgi:diguanylate cyclase (GGDEF)-like protein